MVSRTERTPFAHWWWTVDRLMLAALGVLMLAGIILLLAASPPVAVKLGLDPFHFVNRQGLYLVPAIAILLGISYLSPRQVRRLALVRVRRVGHHAGGDVAIRRRGERRAALACAARRQHPAVRIRQTRFRHSHCLAVRGILAQAGNAGQQRGDGIAAAGDHVAGAAAGFRPDHADRAGLGRAVLHGRDAADLGHRPVRRRRHRSHRRLFHRSARGAALQALFRSVVRRYIPDRQCGRVIHARRVVRPGAGRGDRETHSCPTVTPTSCSRSRPRNSASCSVFCWSRCFASS